MYIAYRSHQSYALEPGDYNISVYDWEVESDVFPGPGPAAVMSVSVTTQKSNQNNKMMTLFYLFSFKLDIQDSLGEKFVMLLLFIVLLKLCVCIHQE